MNFIQAWRMYGLFKWYDLIHNPFEYLGFIKRVISQTIWRIRHGFWECETWNIDHELARWIVPRLKEFPIHMFEDMDEEEFNNFVFIMEHIADEDTCWDMEFWNEHDDEYERAMNWFAQNFRALWW